MIPPIPMGPSLERKDIPSIHPVQLSEESLVLIKSPDFELRRREVARLYEEYKKGDQELSRAIDGLSPRLLSLCKTRDQRRAIQYSLELGVVAHQYNNDIKARTRKKDGSAYFFHPLEMIERYLESGLSDWVTPVAIFLHDVAEDGNFGEGLSEKEEWLSLINNDFNAIIPYEIKGSENSYKLGDLVADLVLGVSERKVPSGMEEFLRQTPLEKMIRAFVEKGGIRTAHIQNQPGRDLGELSAKIDEVCYNLYELMESAAQSPDHLRILVVKLLDLWHNFQSYDYVKEAKMLRGRVGAGIAHWMGWFTLESDIIEKLAEVTDVNTPYYPRVKPDVRVTPAGYEPQVPADDRVRFFLDTLTSFLKKHGQYGLLSQLEKMEEADIKRTGSTLRLKMKEGESEFLFQWGFKYTATGEYGRGSTRNTLPLPVLRIRTNTVNSFPVHFYVRHSPVENELEELSRIFGNRFETDRVRGGGLPEVSVNIRGKNATPYPIDLFRSHRDDIPWKSIPNMCLFLNPFPKTVPLSQTPPDELQRAEKRHFSDLVATFYEPGTVCTLGEGALVYYDGKKSTFCFLDAKGILPRRYTEWGIIDKKTIKYALNQKFFDVARLRIGRPGSQGENYDIHLDRLFFNQVTYRHRLLSNRIVTPLGL